mgnify:CR=1 FL=1
MTNEEFMQQLGEWMAVEVSADLPAAGGYSQVSWNPNEAKNSAGLIRTVATAILEKNAGTKHITFQHEYDIDADDYTKHRVLFW